MLVYKCDGESFSTRKKCSNESTRDLPEWWLTVSGKIKNGLHDAHYIEANGTYHFCSKRCLENFLFKDLNATSAITGNSGMNNNFDPKEPQQEAAGAAAEAQAANETAEQAAEGTQSAEEGQAEG